MKTIISARHMPLTPTLSAYSRSKLSCATARLLDASAARLYVELGHLGQARDHRDMRCRAKLCMPHGRQVVVSARASDMYRAIDRAHHALMMAVKRERGRHHGAAQARRLARRRRPDLGRPRPLAGGRRRAAG